MAKPRDDHAGDSDGRGGIGRSEDAGKIEADRANWHRVARFGRQLRARGRYRDCLMSDSYLSLRVHLVWSTRARRPWLDPEWRARLWVQISSTIAKRGGRLLCAGGVRDHVHLYVELPDTLALADLVNAVKLHSARWIHESFGHRRDFQWQAGYAAFTVAASRDSELQDYIRNQEIHHRQRGFAAEYLQLLEECRVPYDPCSNWQ